MERNSNIFKRISDVGVRRVTNREYQSRGLKFNSIVVKNVNSNNKENDFKNSFKSFKSHFKDRN